MRICEQGRGGGDGEDAGNCGKRSMERGLLGETAKQQQACNWLQHQLQINIKHASSSGFNIMKKMASKIQISVH